MNLIGNYGTPGLTDAITTETFNLFWGGNESRIQILRHQIQVDGSARDAGNGATTNVLRPGLVLGKITATGKYKQYDPAATDGSQTARLILENEVRMTDLHTGANVERLCNGIHAAPIRADAVLILGAALVGHTNEAAVRAALTRIIFDDEV